MTSATWEAATDEAVRRANRQVYNAKRVADYNRNVSIFNGAQRRRLLGILEELQLRSHGSWFLDVGCGTGNLTRLARQVFPHVYGIDQAEQLLARVAREDPVPGLSAAQAHELPFDSESFDVVGLYAVLHHLYDPLPSLGEAFRVLKPGGIVYTDHDPNRYFGRFYHLVHRSRHRTRPAFGSEIEDLAEYHNVYSSGLDPEGLKRALREIGFRSVEVHYRHPTNPTFTGARAVAVQMLKRMARVLPLRSFYTHFMIFAEK